MAGRNRAQEQIVIRLAYYEDWLVTLRLCDCLIIIPWPGRVFLIGGKVRSGGLVYGSWEELID